MNDNHELWATLDSVSEQEADIMDLVLKQESKPESKPFPIESKQESEPTKELWATLDSVPEQESKPKLESKPALKPEPESRSESKPEQANPDQKPDTRTNEPVKSFREYLLRYSPDLEKIEDARQSFIRETGNVKIKDFVTRLKNKNNTPNAIEKINDFQKNFKKYSNRKTEQAKDPFGMTIDDGGDINILVKEWLIDGFIKKEGNGVIFGLPKTGKSFVALDLAMAVTTGKQFAGRFNVKKAGRVWYMTDEDPNGFLERKAATLPVYKPDEAARKRFVFFRTMPQLFKPELRTFGVNNYIRAMKSRFSRDNYPDLVIIDTLRNASFGGNENESGDMSDSIKNAKKLTQAFGCAVIFVHHTSRKNGGLRGSNALEGAVDLMVKVDAKNATRTLGFYAAKNIGGFPTQEFKLQVFENAEPTVKWLGNHKTAGSGKTEQVSARQQILDFLKEHSGERFTIKEISTQTGIPFQTTYSQMGNLVKKYSVVQSLKDAKLKKSPRNPYTYSIQKGEN